MKTLLRKFASLFLSLSFLAMISFPATATTGSVVSTTLAHYTVNGVLSSVDTIGSDSKTSQTTYYDALGRQSYTQNKDNIVTQKWVYGSNNSYQIFTRTYSNGAYINKYDVTYNFGAQTAQLTICNQSLGNSETALSDATAPLSIEEIQTAYSKIADSKSEAHSIGTISSVVESMLKSKGVSSSKAETIAANCYLSSITKETMESLGGVKVARLLNIGTYSSENKGDTTGGKNFINALYKISNSLASGSSFAFSKPKDDSGSEVTFTVYASNREKVSVNLSSYNLKSDDGSKVTTASFNNSPNGTTLTCKAKDGKSLAYDPLVSGTAESVQNIDGKWYIQVKSDKVDMFDGKGFQASDGETILVEVDQNTAATIQSNISSGKNKITVAGNVTADANGQLTMTMNQGGYAMGTDSAQVNKDWTSQHGSFYSNMVTAMAPVWSSAKAAGAGNDWKAGWNFLKSAASGSIALNF